MRPIDADAFWKAMTTRFDSCADLGEIMDVLDSMPTITPDDVRGVGEWLHTSDEFGAYEKCSCCGKEYYCGPIAPFNYCPNCGAKMEVTDDA